MSNPLRPAGPRPHQTRPANQNEMMDELARKIADENDTKARRRINEMREMSPMFARKLWIVGIICLIAAAWLVLSLIDMANKPFTGAYH